jgi:hypothetical protein
MKPRRSRRRILSSRERVFTLILELDKSEVEVAEPELHVDIAVVILRGAPVYRSQPVR